MRAASADEVLAVIEEATGCGVLRGGPGGDATVEVSGPGGPGVRHRVAAMALDALAAWESSREEVRRASVRAGGVGRDADLFQSLAHRLAGARSVAELAATVGECLHERIGVDACGLVGRFDGFPTAHLTLFRSGVHAFVPEIVRRAREAAEDTGGQDTHVRAVPAVRFDAALPPRLGMTGRDLVLVPVPARVEGAAVLAVLPTQEPDPGALRIAHGVAGLLALHAERMAASAKEEEIRFRAILDAMPQAVWLLDRQVRVVRGNRAAGGLSGVLAGVAGERAGSLGSFDLSAAVSDVLDGGAAVHDPDVRIPGGRVLSVTVSAMGNSTGRLVGAVVVADDVTEVRRYQSRIAQAERLSSLGRMLSGVAHELNNPLATVIGFAEMARAAPSSPGLDKRLRLIHDEANRCRRIVGNLLRFARRQDPERRSVVLNELVEGTLGLLAYPLRVDGIRLETVLDRSIPALSADPHEIQQVLINLVTNAHQALREGGRGGTVRVRTEREETGTVLLEVSDDGPGIPEEIRDRIFDPFFTTKPPGEGTGLGLSLVYGTVRSHGGSVEVHGAPGEGATFRVRLPSGAPAAVPAAPEGDASARVDLGGARILVVDDEPGVALLICESLAREGCRVLSAHDAPSVQELLRSREFDLVVCDLRMAGLGAERLHRLLVDDGRGLDRGMVLTTGDTVSLHGENVAASIGATLLHKPFQLSALREAVRAGLDRRRGA